MKDKRSISINIIRKTFLAFFLGGLSFSAMSAELGMLFSKDLPQLAEDQEVQMLTVELQPGEASPPHRHNAHTFVYVLSGSIIMQVKNGEAVTLTAGQTFYESPEDIHTQSANTSDSVPAKIVVIMIKKKGAAITLPAN